MPTNTTTKVSKVTGRMMFDRIKDHPYRPRTCPGCGKDLSRVALVAIVYTFESCDCDVAPYVHLVESLYHQECFAAQWAERAAEESSND